MLEKAGQPSKSPMAYKSRSLHVASVLISLVDGYIIVTFLITKRFAVSGGVSRYQMKTGLETLLMRQSKLSPHCKTNSEDQNKLLSDEECLICLNDNLHDPVNT